MISQELKRDNTGFMGDGKEKRFLSFPHKWWLVSRG
jgi:hypothetical protein